MTLIHLDFFSNVHADFINYILVLIIITHLSANITERYRTTRQTETRTSFLELLKKTNILQYTQREKLLL